MPQNITDVDAFTAPIVAPADGDTRDAASVLTGFQGLANRAKYLYERVITDGVRKVRRFVDTTALKALTGQSHGDIAIVDTDTYLGLYIYDTTVSGADVNPWALKPNGFADGTPGRWRHLFNSFGITNSNPDLNRWAFKHQNHLAGLPEFTSLNSGSPVTLTGSDQAVGPTITINGLLAADKIVIDASAQFDPNAGGSTASWRIGINGAEQTDSEIQISAAMAVHTAQTFLVYTVPSDGNYAIRLLAKDVGSSGNATKIGPRYRLRAQVIRP